MHEKALIKKAAELFLLFNQFKGFYLVGGTALALQIGHRISVDFDFFSQKELPSNLLAKIKRVFKKYTITLTYRSTDQINVLIDGVKVTFLFYPYPVIYKFKTIQNASIVDIREIAAMKALAIGKRLSYKDYVDWYFILSKKYISLSEVIKIARKKFGGDFNDRLFLGQLVSFEDISVQKIDFLSDGVNWETIQNFLKKTVKDYKIN